MLPQKRYIDFVKENIVDKDRSDAQDLFPDSNTVFHNKSKAEIVIVGETHDQLSRRSKN